MADREDNRWVTLVLVCLAQFMVILDATIVNIALPTIQKDLDFSQADLQWVINSYTLLFGGFLLLGGRAADIVGRKRIFIAGTVVFSVASLLNGLATSSEMLIAFRALQGLGGALVSPAALSIITTTFPEGPERTKALGVWSAIAAGGGAVGLLLGGILTEALSWEWIFFVNVPIGAAAALLSARLIRESKAERAGAFDIFGAVLVTAGLMVLVYAIVKAESFGWGSGRTLGLAAFGIALLIVFGIVESRITGPLVRLGIFKIRSLSIANFVLLLVAGGLFALFFFATLYVQEVLGFKPIKAGFAFLPVAIGIGLGAGTAQVLVKQLGVRANTIVGMVIAAAGPLLSLARPGRRHLLGRPVPRPRADGVRHGQHVRADHADRDDQRRRARRRPGQRPVQHLTAGGRRVGPGRPVDARGGQDDELPARPWPPAGAARAGGGAGGGLPGRLHVGGDPGHDRGDPARPAAPQSRRREREPGAGCDGGGLRPTCSDRQCGRG